MPYRQGNKLLNLRFSLSLASSCSTFIPVYLLCLLVASFLALCRPSCSPMISRCHCPSKRDGLSLHESSSKEKHRIRAMARPTTSLVVQALLFCLSLHSYTAAKKGMQEKQSGSLVRNDPYLRFKRLQFFSLSSSYPHREISSLLILFSNLPFAFYIITPNLNTQHVCSSCSFTRF